MSAEIATVQKLNLAGEVVIGWTGRVLARDAHGVRVGAEWARGRLALGYVTFEPGDHLVEYFYADRWYNVYAIFAAADGAHKGWYCNLTRPAEIGPAPDGEGLLIRAVDLALDYFVGPDGRELILDADEFAALPLPPDEVAAASAALDELRALAAQRAGPFALAAA